MKRSQMVCDGCVKLEGSVCHAEPRPLEIDRPQEHWCAQGQWRRWSERYEEMEPFYWGEWDE